MDLVARAAALPASWWICTALASGGAVVVMAWSIVQAWRRSG